MTAGAYDPHVGMVVEGRGDEFALPVLLRKWLQERSGWRDVLGKPVPCHGRDKAMRLSGLEGYVATAAGRPGCCGVLVVLDAETDAACELGPELHVRARNVAGKPVVVILAEPKFEAWFVASAETMELPGLVYRSDCDPEWLIRSALDVKYVKPTWQPRLASRVNFGLGTQRSRSLLRLLERFDQLRGEIPENV